MEIGKGKAIYLRDRAKKPLQAPLWNSQVTLVDSTRFSVDPGQLDPEMVRWVQRRDKDLSLEDLRIRMPRSHSYPTIEIEFQTESASIPLQIEPKLGPSPEVASKLALKPENLRQTPVCTQDMVDNWLQEVQGLLDLDPILDLEDILDLEGLTIHDSNDDSGESAPVNPTIVRQIAFVGQTTPHAQPKTSQRAKPHDLEMIRAKILNRIAYLEDQQMAQAKTQTLFNPEFEGPTQNLQGEFEKEVEKYRDNPRLFELLNKYKEVFGPLPPPSAACPLAQMDIQMKEEWKGKPLRQKCWPMPMKDNKNWKDKRKSWCKPDLPNHTRPVTTHKCAHRPFLLTRKSRSPGEW